MPDFYDEPQQRADSSFFSFTDTLAAPFRGIEGAAQDLYGLFDTLTGDNLLPDWEERLLGESSSTVGSFVEGTANLLAGFIPVAGFLSKGGKVASAVGLGGLSSKAIAGASGLSKAARVGAKGAIAGAVADFAVFDGHEERLSNWLQQFPALQNPAFDYLAADDSDSEIEGRLKNALEGLGAGLFVDGVFGVLKRLRKGRSVREAGGSPQAVEEAMENEYSSRQMEVAFFNPQGNAGDIGDFAAAPEVPLKPDQGDFVENIKANMDALGLQSDEVSTISRFIDSVGKSVFSDLKLSIKETNVQGAFDYTNSVVTIGTKAIQSGTVERTVLHELWHSLERFLPEKKVAPLLEQFNRERDAFYRKGGDLGSPEGYRFESMSEWFAETLTDKVKGGAEQAPKGIFGHAAAWLRDVVDGIRSVWGRDHAQRIFEDFTEGKFVDRVREGGLTGGSVKFSDQLREVAADVAARKAEGLDPAVNPRELSSLELADQRISKIGHNLSSFRGGDKLHAVRSTELVYQDVIKADPNLTPQKLVDLNEQSFKLLVDDLAVPPGKQDAFKLRLLRGLGQAQQDLPAIHARIRTARRFIQDEGGRIGGLLEKVPGGHLNDRELLSLDDDVKEFGELLAITRGLVAEQGRGLRFLREAVDDNFNREAFAKDLEAERSLPAPEPKVADEAAEGAAKETPSAPTEVTPEPQPRQPEIDLDEQGRTAEDIALEINRRGGRDHIIKNLEKMQKAFEESKIAGIVPLATISRGRRSLLMLTEYWMNSILSGPKTLLVNLSSLGLSVYRPLEAMVGAATASAFTRGDGETANFFREFVRFGHVFSSQFSEVMRMGGEAFRTGEGVLNPRSSKFEDGTRAITSGNVGLDPDSRVGSLFDSFAENVIRLPSKILTATDEVVKQLNYRTVVQADLLRQGMEQGLTGDALARFVTDQFDEMIVNGQAYSAKSLHDRGLAEARSRGATGAEAFEQASSFVADNWNEDLGALSQRALEVGEDVTFTKELRKDSIGASVQRFTTKHPTLRLIAPFVRTPLNIIQFGVDRLDPFGPARALGGVIFPSTMPKADATKNRFLRDMLSKDKKRQAEATGRLVAGVGFATMGSILASSGTLTGRGPANREQRQLLEESGWLPYSIKTGDGYVSYARLDPFATILGTIADIAEYSKWTDEEGQGLLESAQWATVTALANNFTNKSYLTGIRGFVQAISDPQRALPTFIRRYAGSFVPSALAQSVNAAGGDEVLREVNSSLDAAMARIPFFSSDLPPIRNVLGDPVKRITSLGYDSIGSITDMFLPIAYREVNDDEIMQEFSTLGHGFSAPRSTKGPIDLRTFKNAKGQDAYDRWLQLHGEVTIGDRTLKRSLRRLIRSDAYKQMSAESSFDIESPRIQAIKSVITRYKNQAYRQVLREFPELKEAEGNVLRAKQGLRVGLDIRNPNLFGLE